MAAGFPFSKHDHSQHNHGDDGMMSITKAQNIRAHLVWSCQGAVDGGELFSQGTIHMEVVDGGPWRLWVLRAVRERVHIVQVFHPTSKRDRRSRHGGRVGGGRLIHSFHPALVNPREEACHDALFRTDAMSSPHALLMHINSQNEPKLCHVVTEIAGHSQ